ncbi:MAG TPA: type III pantothenate kinase, partial [Alphaproteobacteria bacterium]|nr:type III pantothenate kinase [Alphaproteobacteria bacterium]
MLLLFDIGNTHTHLGLADDKRVVKHTNIATAKWFDGGAAALVKRFVGRNEPNGAMVCSVVPRATPLARKTVRAAWNLEATELTAKTTR